MTKEASPPLSRLKNSVLPALLFALTFIAWLQFVCDVKDVFEFDSDDGNNVIKGLLLLEGHSFGDEIWSDQPPVFSFLLAGAFWIFGMTMEVARAVVAFFSASIVFFVYELLRRWSGHVAAISGVVLLFTSSLFVHLSLSVMIGLPSIAFAICGLYLLDRARAQVLSGGPIAFGAGSAGPWLLGAGASGALSLGTKMFTAPVIFISGLVALGVGLKAGEEKEGASPLKTILLGGALYGAGLTLGALIAFSPLIEAGTLSGMIEAHALSRARKTGSSDGARNLARFLRDDSALFALAAVGGVFALARRAIGPLVFGAWFLLCFYALLDHHPVWTHHRTLLTIPAALLAGFAMGTIAETAGGRDKGRPASSASESTWALGLTLLTLITSLVLFSDQDRAKSLLEPEGWSKNSVDWAVFEAFEVPAAQSKYVAAARPTHAFRAKKPIPPNLAVTSSKRFVTKLLSPDEVARDIETFAPETILLSERWPSAVRAKVKSLIKKSHVRVFRTSYQRTEIWVEKQLAEKLGLEEERRRSRSRRRVRMRGPEELGARHRSPTNEEPGQRDDTRDVPEPEEDEEDEDD